MPIHSNLIRTFSDEPAMLSRVISRVKGLGDDLVSDEFLLCGHLLALSSCNDFGNRSLKAGIAFRLYLFYVHERILAICVPFSAGSRLLNSQARA
jgi:hypothetical protein